MFQYERLEFVPAPIAFSPTDHKVIKKGRRIYHPEDPDRHMDLLCDMNVFVREKDGDAPCYIAEVAGDPHSFSTSSNSQDAVNGALARHFFP